MPSSNSNQIKEINWDARFKSICNFCKDYDNSPVLSTGSPQSAIINSRLETLSKHLFSDLDPSIFDYSFSKGSGKVPKAPWVSINLKGKKVSNSISFVICFARSGDGLVLGLMSPSSYKSFVDTVERTKIKEALIIDHKDKNKYDNRFVNPIEIRTNELTYALIQSHKHTCCKILIENFSKAYI